MDLRHRSGHRSVRLAGRTSPQSGKRRSKRRVATGPSTPTPTASADTPEVHTEQTDTTCIVQPAAVRCIAATIPKRQAGRHAVAVEARVVAFVIARPFARIVTEFNGL